MDKRERPEASGGVQSRERNRLEVPKARKVGCVAGEGKLEGV